MSSRPDHADDRHAAPARPGDGTAAPGHTPGRIDDDAVDRFFDNELDDASRRAFLGSLHADIDRCEEVAKTRRMLSMLRAGPEGEDGSAIVAPDLTGRIIAATDRRRSFASRAVRRSARSIRVAMAAALVLLVGGVAIVERASPDAMRLSPAPAPLSSALRESRAEMASTLGSVATTFETIQSRVTPVVAPVHTVVVRPEHGEVRITRFVSGEVVVAGLDMPADPHSSGPECAPMWPGRVSPGGVYVAASDHGPSGSMVVSVGMALTSKTRPRMAEWSVHVATQGSEGAAPPVPLLLDAEGRSTALVVPLGVDRPGFGRPGEPGAMHFVLPGRDLPSLRLQAAPAPVGFPAGVVPIHGGRAPLVP